MARAVVVGGWTLSAAAEAAGVSVRCARKWVGRYRWRARRVCSIAPRRRRRVANRTPAERVAAIVALRQLRMTAAEIAEMLAMPLSTVSVVLKRHGWAGSAASGSSSRSVRVLTAGRARPSSTSRSSAGSHGGAGKRVFGGISAATARPHRRRRPSPQRPSAGSTSTSPSTTTAASPTPRCSPTRRPSTAAGFLRRAVAYYQPPRHPGRAYPDRQRQLPIAATSTRSPAAASASATAAPAPTGPNQRQSRTLHPHHAQRLGLRRHLPLKPRTHRRP